MEIYLDDSASSDELASFLTQAGHNVYTPRSEGTLGALDPRHMEYAASRGYAVITKNPGDFHTLHRHWQAQGRSHSGIFLIYEDNIKGKDMEPPDIVRALGNLLASGLSIPNELHILNHWR